MQELFQFYRPVHLGPPGQSLPKRRTNPKKIREMKNEKREREIIYSGDVMEIIVITLIVKMPHLQGYVSSIYQSGCK